MNDDPRLGGPFNTPNERPKIFTADEQEIINEIKPIIQSMRVRLCIKAGNFYNLLLVIQFVYVHRSIYFKTKGQMGRTD